MCTALCMHGLVCGLRASSMPTPPPPCTSLARQFPPPPRASLARQFPPACASLARQPPPPARLVRNPPPPARLVSAKLPPPPPVRLVSANPPPPPPERGARSRSSNGHLTDNSLSARLRFSCNGGWQFFQFFGIRDSLVLSWGRHLERIGEPHIVEALCWTNISLSPNMHV